MKGTPERIWKDILYVKYDFKFHVEDIDTVFLFWLISEYLFLVKGMV